MRVGLIYVVVNAAFVGLAALLAGLLRWPGLLVPLLLAEMTMLYWVLGQVLQKSGDAYRPFVLNAISLPLQRVHALLFRAGPRN
jgi:hypothetical protein